MKINLLIATAAASAVFATSSADAALLAGFNFNNGEITPSTTLFGVFFTSGTVEVFDATAETISPASSGLYGATATLDLSGLQGPMGGSTGERWGTSVGTSLSAVSGDPAGRSFAVAGVANNGSSIVFSIPTTLAEDITVVYDAQRDGSGATTHAWDYSLDGTTWVNLTTLSGHMGAT